MSIQNHKFYEEQLLNMVIDSQVESEKYLEWSLKEFLLEEEA